MKTSNKIILIASVLVGSSSASIMVWEQLPADSLLESLKVLAGAIGGWAVTSALVFLMAWTFFNLVFAFTRWVWERFDRTPTL
jgi:hypothetical protein